MTPQVQPLSKMDILKPESMYSIALRVMIDTKIRAESDKEQTEVYAKIRRNNLYYRGFQYLQMVRGQNGAIDYRPVGASQGGGMDVSTPANNRDNDQMYDNTLALFRGDVRKWCGVLGVRSPNANCSPRMVGDDQQIRLSRIGDRAISYLRNTWKSDELQRYLAYSLAVNGTTFGYVNLVADPNKYGVSEIPRLESVEVPDGQDRFICWNCGADNSVMAVQSDNHCLQCHSELGPEDFQKAETIPAVIQKGVDRYANAAVEIQLATGATVKTPFYIRDLEHCPWLWYEYLVNRYELIHAHCPEPPRDDKSPQAQAKRELRQSLMSDHTNNSNVGMSTEEVRRTQDTLSAPSGMPLTRRSLAAFGQYWISPGQMEAISTDEDRSGQIREQLFAKYPRGMHLIYINGKLADIRESCIAEQWSGCQPDTGEFIYRDAVFDDYIQGQDVINDSLNMLIQQAEKSSALTFFDPEYVDPDTLRDRSVQTGEFIAAKRIGGGGQLSQGFYKSQGTEINDTLIKFIEFYIQKNRENVGIMPAIYGGGEGDEAVGVAKIRRNQSLMQLNVPWNYMRDFWVQTYTNGMMLLAKYSNGKLYTNRGGIVEMEELDGIQELLQGGIKVECEEAMPMTWAQRQEQVESMLARPPQAWAILGMTDQQGNVSPANVEILQEATGLEDWKVPGLDQRERILDVVHQLLGNDPVDSPPGPPDPQTGQPAEPGTPQPSIQPNQTMFDAPFAVQVLREWLWSDKGREAENSPQQGQSPRGFENVLAYTQAWMNIANAPPPPPPAAPPEQPRVSVSMSPADMLIPGVAEIMAKDFNIGTGQPPASGAPMPPPNTTSPGGPSSPSPPPTGGPGGPSGGMGAPPPPQQAPPPQLSSPGAPGSLDAPAPGGIQ